MTKYENRVLDVTSSSKRLDQQFQVLGAVMHLYHNDNTILAARQIEAIRVANLLRFIYLCYIVFNIRGISADGHVLTANCHSVAATVLRMRVATGKFQ